MKLIHITASERKQLQSNSLRQKVDLSLEMIRNLLSSRPSEKLAVAWTGGKDSTLLLWLVRKAATELRLHLPAVMLIDEGDTFDEMTAFVKKLTRAWRLNISIAHNHDVTNQVKKIGDTVQVNKLNQRNQQELQRLGFTEETFLFYPESLVGNHLMKTVASNEWLEAHHIDTLITGVRWDEQAARARDDYYRQLTAPSHTRFEPILHFLEKDIWQAIHHYHIPYVSLYEAGYRSLGTKTGTQKVSQLPAWKQNLERTKERAGRQQDKEKIMQRLRDLGYM